MIDGPASTQSEDIRLGLRRRGSPANAVDRRPTEVMMALARCWIWTRRAKKRTLTLPARVA